MKVLKTILPLFIVAFIVHCNNPVNTSEAKQRPDFISKKPVSFSKIKSLPDMVIFGTYFGECGNHCTRMYKYISKTSGDSLFADTTDDFFKSWSKGKMNFGKQIRDINRVKAATDIVAHIPDSLLNGYYSRTRFGCPDCTDGGGIFLKVQRDTSMRTFFIDYQTQMLSGDIKLFADYLRQRMNL